MSSISCLFKLIFRYSVHRTINYFALCAIILSICSLFTVNAVFRGFDHELQKMFRGSLADTLIEWNWSPPKLKDLEKDLTPLAVWAPALDGFGMIKTERFVSAISFKGVDAIREKKLRKSMKISNIDFSPLDDIESNYESPLGDMLSLFNESSDNKPLAPMLVGEVLAKNLNIKIGDKIKLVIPNWRDEIKSGEFKVTGFFKSGIYEDDQGKVFISINEAQNLLSRPNGYSYIQCDFPTNASLNKKSITKLYPSAKLTSWKEKHKIQLKAVNHERKLIAIVLSLIVLVSSFGILAIQWSFVLEKTSDIGILRAIGFSGIDIFAIFLGVTLSIGIIGLSIGLLFGVLLCDNVNQIVDFLGISVFPDDVFYHENLPVVIDRIDFIWISILSLSVTTIAGLVPAWKAIRVEPLTAISHE
jgi:lipoprotein-releasing system permease protein